MIRIHDDQNGIKYQKTHRKIQDLAGDVESELILVERNEGEVYLFFSFWRKVARVECQFAEWVGVYSSEHVGVVPERRHSDVPNLILSSVKPIRCVQV